MSGKRISSEALISLRNRLSGVPSRSNERRTIMQETATLYGFSEATLYRALRDYHRPKSLRRSDCGQPRILSIEAMESYCEIIAAIKIRTSNQKGRHLSTSETIRLLEEFGLETPKGFIKAVPGQLNKSTVNRYLKQWGYDRNYLIRQPPAVRFQAKHSNACWHFDLSPSDLKHVKQPLWLDKDRGSPTLMLYSVVDDRSGVAYQEYHCVYGEDVEAAMRFMFTAMSPKKNAQCIIGGIAYEVDPDLAGENVVLWWGLFDSELYVEFGEKRYGPYHSVNGPIPLGRYRSFKKTKQQKRADRIEGLARDIQLPRAALDNNQSAATLVAFALDQEASKTAFNDPDPFIEFTFPDQVSAKQAIAIELGLPLAKLTQEQRDYINKIVAETLNKTMVFEQIHAFFDSSIKGKQHVK